jgi:hypothetical protein
MPLAKYFVSVYLMAIDQYLMNVSFGLKILKQFRLNILQVFLKEINRPSKLKRKYA